MTARRGRPRRPDRRRQHRRAGSGGRQRRVRRPAQRPRRGAARRLLHARPAAARRRRWPRIEGVRTPSLVARAVADLTDHHLLVGQGAQEFARGLGFKIEEDLNTEHSRKLWLEWKRRTDPDHYLDPAAREEAGRKVGRQMMDEGLIDPQHYYGTINCNGVNAKGEVCGVTTTSGLAWKIPGPRRRLADPRRRVVGGRRGRGRGLHRARRGEPVQPLVAPHRRGDAARPAPEGRGHGGAAAHPRQHRREAPAERQGQPRLQRQVLRVEPARRVRGRLAVRRARTRTSRSAPSRDRRPCPATPCSRESDAEARPEPKATP